MAVVRCQALIGLLHKALREYGIRVRACGMAKLTEAEYILLAQSIVKLLSNLLLQV